MNKVLCQLVVCILLSCVVTGCKEKASSEDKEEESGYFSLNVDTVVAKDGIKIIVTTRQFPMNELIEVQNDKDQTLAFCASCSERVSYQGIKYRYDKAGRLIGLAECWDLEIEDVSTDKFRKWVFDENVNSEGYSRLDFVFDGQGNIVRITDPITNNNIQAPANHKIEWKVEQNSAFWISDINGGTLLINLYVVPINKSSKDYVKMNYHFYSLRLIEEYKDNKKVKTTLYNIEGIPVKTISKISEGDKHIYTITSYEDNKKIVYTWIKGYPVRMEQISNYGTTLQLIDFELSDNKKSLGLKLWKIDYETRKLIPQKDETRPVVDYKENEVIDLSDEMEKE